MAETAVWFFATNGQQYGPVSAADLKQLASTGQLSASDLIWKEGWPEWKAAGSVKGLIASEPPTTSVPPLLPPLSANAPASISLPPTTNVVDTVQAGLADIMSTAKQAKDLAATHARKTQITQMIFPKAYFALGKHLFEKGRFQEEFTELFQRITDTNDQIATIATTSNQRPQAIGIKGKLQSGAAQLMAQGQTAKLAMQRDSMLKQLGKQAFESHGTSAGSSDLLTPIAAANEEISRLDALIEKLSSGDKGPLWQRLPLAALLTVVCWPVGMLLVWLNPILSCRSKWVWTGVSIAALMMLAIIIPKSKPQNSGATSLSSGLADSDTLALRRSEESSSDPSKELSSVDYAYDFSKDDFKSLPPDAVRHTRTRTIHTQDGDDEDLVGKLETEDGSLDAKGTFVEHGPFTTWADENKTIKCRTGTMYEGKLHGIMLCYHADGSKSKELQFVHGTRHGIQRAWHSNGKPEYVTHWIKDKMHGKETLWYENGQKKVEKCFINGLQHGISTVWYESGTKKIESRWKDGEKEGKEFAWWENGERNYEAYIHLDLCNGPYSVWNKDGFQTHSGSFRNGRKSGEWKISFPACSDGKNCEACNGRPYTVVVNSERWSIGSQEELLTLLHLLSQNGLGVDDTFSPRHGWRHVEVLINRATFEEVFSISIPKPPNGDSFVHRVITIHCKDGLMPLEYTTGIKADGKGTKIIHLFFR